MLSRPTRRRYTPEDYRRMAEGAEAIFALAQAGMVHQGWSTRATRLDYVRARAGLTVSAWAERAQVRESTVSQYRSGKRLLNLNVCDAAHRETVANVLRLLMVARAVGVDIELPWVLGGSQPIHGLEDRNEVSKRARWLRQFMDPDTCREDMDLLCELRSDGHALAPAQRAAARVAAQLGWVDYAWIVGGTATAPPGVEQWRDLLALGEEPSWGWAQPAVLLEQRRALRVTSRQCRILRAMIGMHMSSMLAPDRAQLRKVLRLPGMEQRPWRSRRENARQVLLTLTGRQVMLMCDLLLRRQCQFPAAELDELLTALQSIAPAKSLQLLWASPCESLTVEAMWNRLERWGTMRPATASMTS